MKPFLHLITLIVTLTLAVAGVLAWLFGLKVVESQTFHYDGVADGEIIRAKPKTDGDYLSPGLRYVFQAGGHLVEGEKYRRNFIQKKEFSQAREIAAIYEPGDKVKVYYRVGVGGEIQSVLNPNPDPTAHLLYVGGIPLTLCVITLYLAVVVLRPRAVQQIQVTETEKPTEETEKPTVKKEKKGSSKSKA